MVKGIASLSLVEDKPESGTFGIIGYLSQSNDNANCVPEEDRFKYMDDLTFLEIISLSNIGIASHNLKLNVSSNLPLHNQILPNDHLKSQEFLNTIADWTDKKKMVFKTKSIYNKFKIER